MRIKRALLLRKRGDTMAKFEIKVTKLCIDRKKVIKGF